jgi:hypothetical protein
MLNERDAVRTGYGYFIFSIKLLTAKLSLSPPPSLYRYKQKVKSNEKQRESIHFFNSRRKSRKRPFRHGMAKSFNLLWTRTITSTQWLNHDWKVVKGTGERRRFIGYTFTKFHWDELFHIFFVLWQCYMSNFNWYSQDAVNVYITSYVTSFRVSPWRSLIRDDGPFSSPTKVMTIFSTHISFK